MTKCTIKRRGQIMLDKIKALPDKTLMIGIALQFIAMIFIVFVGFVNEVVINGWLSFSFYVLYFTGLPFIFLAYDKRRKNKQG